jgi:hypothetical protein
MCILLFFRQVAEFLFSINCFVLLSSLSQKDMILKKHPEIKTRFLCLAENAESLFFYKLENTGTRRIETGFEDENLFIVPQKFDFFIRGERRVAYDFQKITDLDIYRSIKKSGPEDQSRSQILKLILEEAIEIVMENLEKRNWTGPSKMS